MRNLRQCMLATVIAAALPFSALAQSAVTNSAIPLSGKTANAQWKNNSVMTGASVQVVAPFILDSLPNAFSYFTNNQQTLQYDPVSGILATIKRGNPDQSGNNLYILTSNDLGQTWSAPVGPLHDNSTGLGRYPSVLIVNPSASTNPDDLIYAFSAPLVSGGGFGPVLSGFLSGTDAITEINSGIDINGETYTWSTDSKLASSADGQTVLAVSKLSGPSGTADLTANNNFALRRLEGFNTWTAVLPPQWNASKFAAADSPTSSTSETVGLARDNSGNFHMAVQGRFINSSDDSKVFPGVSSSTDGGNTWSEFNILPLSAIQTYASANGMNPDSTYFGFSASDFAVTGTNEYSIVMNMFETGLDDAGESSTKAAHLVEVYYSGGAWSIRKIADVSGLVLAYLPDATGAATNNQMGNEVQVSRTADGTKLLAKWVEFYNYVSTAGDTTTGGDVTLAVRSLDSTNWSRPLNVTETEQFDKVTWIPNIVPNDLKNIVILSLETILDGSETTFAEVQEKMRNVNIPQHVVIRAVDPVFTFGPGSGTGINDEVVNNLKMTSVAPNPAYDVAQFAYTLETEGKVSVEVVNVMGQKVLTLDSGFKGQGKHIVTFNTLDLPAGTYYYTLKHNGGSITRMMTIVR